MIWFDLIFVHYLNWIFGFFSFVQKRNNFNYYLGFKILKNNNTLKRYLMLFIHI